MYQIIKDGAVIASVDSPAFIRVQENGCYGLTDEQNADGVAHNDEVYSLGGIEGAEIVSVEYIPPTPEPTAETIKTEALAAMQKATTIKDVKAAFTKYAEADGITITQG